MGKRSLLLVDGDARSLRVLEVSLRKAGFLITTAVNGRDALDKARTSRPDLILSDTDMPEMDGFALCRELKADSDLARVPFVFLTGETAIESKIRGLELGVDEYLTKPIYIKEILTRIRILLQKQQRARLETRRDPNTRFAGTLHDMGVVDLIQTIEVSRKSGLIHFSGTDGRQATIYFRNGAVIDAETGHLQGADAVYRLLTWSEGEFELLFRTVRRKDAIDMGTQALLMEGMRRLDEWGRLLEQLPSLATRFEVNVAELSDRLSELPDELNRILRLFDGRRSLLDVIDLAGSGDLECIELVSRLYFEGLLHEVEGAPVDSAPEVSTDVALEGWLGRQIPPNDRMPPLSPLPAEIAADAEAEWEASEADAAAEMMWPSLPAASLDAPAHRSKGAPVTVPPPARLAAGTDSVGDAGRAFEDAGVAIERLVAAALSGDVGSAALDVAGGAAPQRGDEASPAPEAKTAAVTANAAPPLATAGLAVEDSPTPHLAQEAAEESPAVNEPRAATPDSADPVRDLVAGGEPATAEPIFTLKQEVVSGAADQSGGPARGALAAASEVGALGADTPALRAAAAASEVGALGAETPALRAAASASAVGALGAETPALRAAAAASEDGALGADTPAPGALASASAVGALGADTPAPGAVAAASGGGGLGADTPVPGAVAAASEGGEFGADTEQLPPELRELARRRSGRGVDAAGGLAMTGPAEESEESDFEAETGKFPPELRELARKRARERGTGEPVAAGSNGASEALEDPDFDGDTAPLPPELRGAGRRRAVGTLDAPAAGPPTSDIDELPDEAAERLGAAAVHGLGSIAEGKPSGVGRGIDGEEPTPRLFASDGRLFDDDFDEPTPALAQERGREFGADTEEMPPSIMAAGPKTSDVADESQTPVLRVDAEVLRQTGEFPGPLLEGSAASARGTGEFPGPVLDESAVSPRETAEFPGPVLDESAAPARGTGEFPGPVLDESAVSPRETAEFPGPVLDVPGESPRVTGEFPGPVMRSDDGLRLTEVFSAPLLRADAEAARTAAGAAGTTPRDPAQDELTGSLADLDAEPPTPPSGMLIELDPAMERDEEPEGVALGRVSLVRRRSEQERAAELGPELGARAFASDEPAWSANGDGAASAGQSVPQPVPFGAGSSGLASSSGKSSEKTEGSDEVVVPPGSVVSDPFDVAAEGVSLAGEDPHSTAAGSAQPVEPASSSASAAAPGAASDGVEPAEGAAADSSASRSDDTGRSSTPISTPSSTQDSPAASQPLPAAAAAAAVFSLSASSGEDAGGILEAEFGTGAITDFDTSDLTPSDLTPLPNPVPLGDERTNPRIKSSRGAEVAMVSGELAAQPRPSPDPDQADMGGLSSRPNGTRPGATGRASTARPVVSPVTPPGGSGNGRLRSVELDQELSAAAEVVELVPPRPAIAVPLPASAEGPAGKMGRARRSPDRSAEAGPDDAMDPPRVRRPSTRVSAMLRAASGHSLARTVAATIAAAVLVGACFGLLFWWFGARNDPPSEDIEAAGAAEGAAASSAGTTRSAASPAAGDEKAHRSPIASGAGDVGRASSAASTATSPGSDSPAQQSPAEQPPAEQSPTESSAQSSAESSAPSSAAAPVAGSTAPPSSPSAAAPVAGSTAPPSPPTAGAPPSAAAPAAASGEQGYDHLYEEAKRARRRRDYQAVLSLSGRALAQRETAQALTLQAEAMTALGESRRALPIADRATEVRPKFSSGWYIKGRIHRTLGENDKARAAFERYLELDPEGTRADQVIDLLQDM